MLTSRLTDFIEIVATNCYANGHLHNCSSESFHHYPGHLLAGILQHPCSYESAYFLDRELY